MEDLAAVLLDMDGTLVDTEPYWFEAEIDLAAAHGGSWTHEQALDLVGSNLTWSAQRMIEDGGVRLPAEEIGRLLVEDVTARVREHVPWRPGVLDLLADLAAHDVPVALVTMSWRPLADAVIGALPDDTFAAVVTGDVVDHPKPHPEPYLRAAADLGVDPADCVAVEDSEAGTRSAEDAGCLVLAVTNHVPIGPGHARVPLTTLEGVDVARLHALLAEHRPARPARPA